MSEDLPDPYQPEATRVVAKQSVLARLIHSQIDSPHAHQDVKPLERHDDLSSTLTSGVNQLGHEAHTEAKPSAILSLRRPEKETAAVADEEDEEVEGDYDSEDNEVIVPWIGPRHSLVAGEADMDAEGVYSEDEVFDGELDHSLTAHHMISDLEHQPLRQAQQAESATRVSQVADEFLPAARPNFPLSPDQFHFKPYPLDDEARDILVPATINRFLKDYQRTGAKFLYSKYKQQTGAVLGDDMGPVSLAVTVSEADVLIVWARPFKSSPLCACICSRLLAEGCPSCPLS